MARPSDLRRRRKHLLGVVLIAGSLAAVLGVAALRWSLGRQVVELDPRNLCPKEGGAHGYVSILFDVSDPLRPVQQEALLKEVNDIEAEIPAYHSVQVFVIHASDETGLPKPEFDKCKPPSVGPEDATWTRNLPRMRQRYDVEYRKPLEERLVALRQAPPTRDSPILELIQAAAITAFPGHASDAPRKLIIISDFLQHTQRYSHYGTGSPRFRTFERLPFARTLRADLSKVEVVTLYLFRDGQEHVQGAAHIEFWKEVFVWDGVKAGRLSVIPIPGGGPSAAAPLAASEKR